MGNVTINKTLEGIISLIAKQLGMRSLDQRVGNSLNLPETPECFPKYRFPCMSVLIVP